MSGKGFKFVGKTKQVEKAPEALRGLPATESNDIKPSAMTTALRGMFSRAAPVVAPSKVIAKGPKVLKALNAPKILKALNASKILKASIQEKEVDPIVEATELETETTELETETPELETETPELENEETENEETTTIRLKKKFKLKKPVEYGRFEDANLDEMARLIREEERRDPYESTAPTAFVPETRRGFSEFIKETYSNFTLEPTEKALPTEAGDKYPYQKFIREYMRQASPYRGVLTYHGLGSGKTCTAIAASEALFSTANKKIIVMTPASLKKNFLKEVSLCGFRHFRLQNYWESMPLDQTVRLFATSVLGLSESYLRTAKSIWIPDFRKTVDEANYSNLTSDERTEIRKQILSLLVWDEEKNPTGRIRFINYNGISAKKLQAIACKKPHADFFDDAVIIIDEIHNVGRLMQGTIDPYLVKMKGLRRLIPMEEITPNKWNPSLCLQGLKTYARGYLFYRLLLDAQNSKIIGLSGTPLINFPEEMGILMNVLHGYIPTIEITVNKVGSAIQKQLTDLMDAYIYVDYIKVLQAPSGQGTQIVCSLLPYGVRKISNDIGVERIPQGEEIPTIDIIVNEIQQILEKADFIIRGSIVTKAQELLPPFADSFHDKFIGKGVELNNKIVLVKRLTGLVSDYKGSRADLMPSVKVDEVVRVPMSLYSQKKYVEARETEISSEKKKTKQPGSMGGVWAEVYEVGGESQSSNYKMASRQACNFTFPPNVLRPKPKTKKEAMAEATNGDKQGDIIDGIEEDSDEKFPELEELDLQERAEIDAVAEEDALKDAELEAESEVVGIVDAVDAVDGPVAPASVAPVASVAPASVASVAPASVAQVGGANEDEDEDESTGSLVPLPIESTSTLAIAPKKFALKGLMQKKTAELQAECKSGKEGEAYPDAVIRAKECLQTLGRDNLKLGTPTGLEQCSPKFAEMLTRIAAAPGSSLVYSFFLDMEGIGIFSMCMDINGYAPIEIIRGPLGLSFSKATEASFRKGTNVQPRYITFTGNEKEDIRRLALDIFNAKFDELPTSIKTILTESGYTTNHKGEICRVFCITAAGAEGLSLKNVRAVHIMEPYWNDVRLRQVKGRAIRIGSHLELPEADRNVSIYTYLSCFSKDAQLLKAGDGRIDETIRVADRVERKEAVTLALPIPERATEYIVTTDERIFLIAQRKKGILNSLENVMKSAAIDCELNIQQNRDGSFKCLPLKGKVGDFLYHPNLEIDIRESASMYAIEDKTINVPVKPNYILQKFKGTIYRMKLVEGGFEMYAEDDVEMKRILGTAGVKDGKPAPPVKFL